MWTRKTCWKCGEPRWTDDAPQDGEGEREREMANMTLPKCRVCGGTGRIWSMRSWFRSDGFYASECGYCGGTGQSTARTDARYERFQAEGREWAARQRKSAQVTR
jgi:DnaJ-class molecular chaperone